MNTPAAFHVMAKPVGPQCNMACDYCFYRRKIELFEPGAELRMSDEVLRAFVQQYMEGQRVPEVHFAWQGGEPTLAGLEFYKRVVELQGHYRRNGMRVHNLLQTNGLLLDAAWARFLGEHGFLVGLSMDGNRAMQDAYRRDRGGGSTFDRVVAAVKVLRDFGVPFNVLCTVNRANADQPLELYGFLKSMGATYIQLIPLAVESPGAPPGEWAVDADAWGRFLCTIFDAWYQRDAGRIYVQLFDVALEAWLGMEPSLCIFSRNCGAALAIEHNGDVFSCDHYVTPQHRLGNILERPLAQLVALPQQHRFGRMKSETLPVQCVQCRVRFACNGGCPRNRLPATDPHQPGLNRFCRGYKQFFEHIAGPMERMAATLRSNPPHLPVLTGFQGNGSSGKVGRNQPCPCGSGRKSKHCCARD